MHEESQNPIDDIRSSKREDLTDVRNKHKEAVLCNKRLRLDEVQKYVNEVNISEFKELLLKLKQKNVPFEVIRKIKNSLIHVKNIEYFIRNGEALSFLTRILIGNDALKQVEAVACVTNLVCGSHKCCEKVGKTVGVYLILFINGNNPILQDQSAWASANIANDCVKCFNIIKSQGILPALLKNLQSSFLNVVQSVIFALNACTKYEEPEIISLVQSGLQKDLFPFLESNNVSKSLFLDAAFTLCNCCYINSKHSLKVLNLNDVQSVIGVLRRIVNNPETDSLLSVPLIRCLGFLVCDDDLCELISEDKIFYENIYVLLSRNEHIALKREILWVLTNITAQKSVSHHFLMPVIDTLKIFANLEDTGTLQVLYFLCSLASTSDIWSSLLSGHEIYSFLKCLLKSEKSDIKHATKILFKIIGHL